jgi:hypothetical protein
MMHESARRAMLDRIRKSPRERIDAALDDYCDCLFRATEWDAAQWGFEPDAWQAAERAQLRTRGGRDWPTEVI